MDFKNIFIGIAIAVLCVIGYTGIVSSWNNAYNTTNTAGFSNQTIQKINVITNISSISQDLGEDTAGTDTNVTDAGSSSSDTSLIRMGLRSLKRIPMLIGLVPSMMREGASMLAIDKEYEGLIELGVAIFIIIFALTFMYVLILGVKKL